MRVLYLLWAVYCTILFFMKAKEIIHIIQSQSSTEEQGKSFKVGFFLCTSGTASLLIEDVLYPIRRHTLTMLYPNAQIHVVQHSDDWEGRIETDYVEYYYPTIEAIDAHDRLFIRNSPCVTITPEEADYLHRLCDLAHVESPLTQAIARQQFTHTSIGKLGEFRHRYLRSTILVDIVGIFLTHRPQEAHTPSKHETIVSDFLMLLFKNAHAERTIQYYADRLHLSPYYLSTIIKEATGKGALEWITLFTINMCKHYLVDTDMSVKEIADTMHFPDQSTFGRYFKHHMACSPGEYRKAAKP